MLLINCEINLILSWWSTCVITNSSGAGTYAIIDTNLYILVVTSSIQDDTKLLQKLKSGFQRKINWNKHQSKLTIQEWNQYLDFLIDPSLQGVNRLFVLLFEDNGDRKVHTGYFLPKAEMKGYNVMIDGQKLFD